MWGKDKMKNEKIYYPEKQPGLNKENIENILKCGVKSCVIAALPISVLIYKNGGYYGTISIYDFYL